jgi:AcrR family transcriptional regulator
MSPAARTSRRAILATPRPETRDRLIAAAAAVFAERGYRGATMRAIADRSGANLAAAHYHFGSKQDLYREVVRSHFERLAQRLAERGAAIDAATAARLSREQLVELLHARVRTMLETLLEPTGIHATLMQRELADPSETLPVIVRRWIDPLRQDMVLLLQRLAPKLSGERLQFCVRSLMGQVSFYFTHRPALLLMMRRRAYPPGFVEEVTEHVVAFTLGGLDGVGQTDGRKRARKEALQEGKP